MNLFIRELNVNNLRDGSVLRHKTNKTFYVIINISHTWFHRHKYFDCIKVNRFIDIKTIPFVLDDVSRIRLYSYELDKLEEVVLI